MLHLINNLLDGGKAEVGDLEVNPAACEVIPLMEKLWSISS